MHSDGLRRLCAVRMAGTDLLVPAGEEGTDRLDGEAVAVDRAILWHSGSQSQGERVALLRERLPNGLRDVEPLGTV